MANSKIFQVRFLDPNQSVFFSTLRKRVDEYFKLNNISRFHNREMLLKTCIMLGAYLIPFAVLLSFDLSVIAGMSLWAIMGLALAGIGMSVMHDANHGAYSSSRSVNFWLGHTLNLLGGSVFNWKIQHNQLHHTFTNVVHHDDDVDDKLIMRFSPHTSVKWYHKLQYLYAFAFYGLLSLYWAVAKDFVQFIKYRREGKNNKSAKENRHIFARIVLSKIAYFSVFLLLPLNILHKSPVLVVGGFLLMHFIAGVVLTVIFQLAHTVEGTGHPLPDQSGTILECWAIHQMRTTVDFARGNRWLSWYIGGLNFQIEHHLFPTICHVHYPHIAPIVKATAEEFGIPYLENPTFAKALRSHVNLLKTFGKLPSLNEAIS